MIDRASQWFYKICNTAYPLAIWCKWVTKRLELGVLSKTNEGKINIQDLQNNLFWGFVCCYKTPLFRIRHNFLLLTTEADKDHTPYSDRVNLQAELFTLNVLSRDHFKSLSFIFSLNSSVDGDSEHCYCWSSVIDKTETGYSYSENQNYDAV